MEGASARAGLFFKKRIKKGDILNEDNLIVKRPGNGINPMNWYKILGSVAKKNYEEDDLI